MDERRGRLFQRIYVGLWTSAYASADAFCFELINLKRRDVGFWSELGALAGTRSSRQLGGIPFWKGDVRCLLFARKDAVKACKVRVGLCNGNLG